MLHRWKTPKLSTSPSDLGGFHRALQQRKDLFDWICGWHFGTFDTTNGVDLWSL